MSPREDAPADRGGLVGIIFFILGLKMLLPWNFFMMASMTEKCEEEIVKLQFDLQESRKIKKPKSPEFKGLRNTNPVKAVRWDSMENLKPNFCRYQAVEYHSDESERSRIKHQELKLQNVTGVRSPSWTTFFSLNTFCVSSRAGHLELR